MSGAFSAWARAGAARVIDATSMRVHTTERMGDMRIHLLEQTVSGKQSRNAKLIRKKHAPVRHYGVPLGVPAVPGAAAGRQDHPSLVRRVGVRLDGVHAFLPGAAAARLLLRARLHSLAGATAT